MSISVQKFAHYAFCKCFNQGRESFANSTTGVTIISNFTDYAVFTKYEVNQSLQASYTRHLFVEQMSEGKTPSGRYLGQRANRRSQTRSGAPVTKANKKVVAYCSTSSKEWPLWGLPTVQMLGYSTSTTTFIRAFRDPSDLVTNFIAESLLQI